MHIKKVYIENFKRFKEFDLELKPGSNLLVGDNEAGKSTIMEAINLALTGMLHGRYLKREINQYIFNNEAVSKYLESMKTNKKSEPPSILIEIYFDDSDAVCPKFQGNGNHGSEDVCGLSYEIEFDEDNYKEEYKQFCESKKFFSLPVEFYRVIWESFAREHIIQKMIPLKSFLIDSNHQHFYNKSDDYISYVIKHVLNDQDKIDVSLAYRNALKGFEDDDAIVNINAIITGQQNIAVPKDIKLSTDLSPNNNWEKVTTTHIGKIPFHYIGKGAQRTIKTLLTLCGDKPEQSNLIMLEEPENNLSHTSLHQFMHDINDRCKGKQIIISTHSSFVANKLGLGGLIFLDKEAKSFSNLTPGTQKFFKKLPGYNTLRLLLCKKAILVEGPSDELIIQRAYRDHNEDKLPIDDCIDVISVGNSFLRFLEIADLVEKKTVVVQDNDRNYKEKIEKKYSKYIKTPQNYSHVKIVYSKEDEFYTLEPQLVDANKNDLRGFASIIGCKAKSVSHKSLCIYMEDKKTECAMRIFDAKKKIIYPKYILEAIAKNEE